MDSYSIKVYNLMPDVDCRDIQKVFGEIGEITDIALNKPNHYQYQSVKIWYKSLYAAVIAVIRFDDAMTSLASKSLRVTGGSKEVSAKVKQTYDKMEWICPLDVDDDDSKKENQTLIIVRNFKNLLDESQLKELFLRFGTIDSVSIKSGYGYIDYAKHSSALWAIKIMQGWIVGGRALQVDFVVSKECRMKSSNNEHGTKHGSPLKPVEEQTLIIVRNFKDILDEDELRNEFKIFGQINSVSISRDQSGRSKGYGYIDFMKHVSALNAVNAMNGFFVQHRELKVDFVKPKEVRGKTDTTNQNHTDIVLLVKGLPRCFGDDDLKQLFSVFGHVLHSATKVYGKSKTAVGYVTFAKIDEARKAVADMNSFNLNGCVLQVSFKTEKKTTPTEREHTRMAIPHMAPGPAYHPHMRGSNLFKLQLQSQSLPFSAF